MAGKTGRFMCVRKVEKKDSDGLRALGRIVSGRRK